MCRRAADRDVLEVVDLRRVGEAEDTADARPGVGVGDLPVGEQLHLLSFSAVVILASSASTLRSIPALGACRTGVRAASSAAGSGAGALLATVVTVRTAAARASTLASRFIVASEMLRV